MPPKRKSDKPVIRKAVIVKDQGIYSALECWAVSVNELYNALVTAGFRPSYALGITIDKAPLPDWLFPDFDPFDDDDDLDDLDDD
jgi:hypothetical protein